MASVELKNIYKKFDDVEVLHDINLKIDEGAFVVLVGPSGCGKSTTLRLVAGLEDVTRGDVIINDKVVNIIASHHHEMDQESVEAVIAEAADAISGARPGARREDLEQYIKRLRALENIANSYKGVDRSYAIQAGREVRILVDSSLVNDKETVWLSKDIAKRIESELEYPGQVRVNVIRETRASEFAK